jgi:hypothetical protein
MAGAPRTRRERMASNISSELDKRKKHHIFRQQRLVKENEAIILRVVTYGLKVHVQSPAQGAAIPGL